MIEKLLLTSILPATLLIALRAARAPSPRSALRRAAKELLLFEISYLFALLYVYPRVAS